MAHHTRGFGLRLTGMILGIIGTVVSITALFFAIFGMARARQCKNCKMEGMYK